MVWTAQGYVFHHAFGAAGFDEVADPKGIIDQKEYPRYDIFDEGLGAKTDCQTKHAGAGNQGTDVNPQ